APARIAQGRDDDVGPEAAAVLAQAPALVLVLPRSGGDLQLPRRLARCYILRRIEAREVLADDLRGAVALDALGAGVPGEGAGLRVEEEDGVVLDPLDEEAEAFLGGGQALGRLGRGAVRVRGASSEKSSQKLQHVARPHVSGC